MKPIWNNSYTVARRFSPPLFLALMLSACGGSYETGYASFSSRNFATDTKNKAVGAVETPLKDLGLMEDEIPARLEALISNPYTLEKGTTCDGLRTEMDALNELLGPDIDTPKMALASQDSAFSQGADLVSDAAIGFVRSQVNIIPMRSIVRTLTGARKHEKRLARANEAGKLRRAYIKGVAMAKYDGKCFIGPAVPVTEAKAVDKKPVEQEVASVVTN